MARIKGVDIPDNKRIEIALTYIYGIGRNLSNQILKDANVDINLSMLEKAYKKNIFLNTLNWGTGFVISALFLSTIIPKIQYLITRLTTGSNSFPGTAEYNDKK